jgi:hypothetical protein
MSIFVLFLEKVRILALNLTKETAAASKAQFFKRVRRKKQRQQKARRAERRRVKNGH